MKVVDNKMLGVLNNKNSKQGQRKIILLYLLLLFISFIFSSILLSPQSMAVRVTFEMSKETIEADVMTNWGVFFTDENGNIIRDGDQLCVGDKIFVEKTADIEWYFEGGQTSCPQAQIMSRDEMKKLTCGLNKIRPIKQGDCYNCYPNSALHSWAPCPWPKGKEPEVGDIFVDHLENTNKWGFGYTCLSLSIKDHVLQGPLKYTSTLNKHYMNLICNGTTRDNEDLAEIIGKKRFVTEATKPGLLTLNPEDYSSVNSELTLYCIFWHSWSSSKTRQDCLRNARVCYPQSYFPVILEPTSKLITVNVVDPNIRLKIKNSVIEKDNAGNAIVSFSVINDGKQDVSVKSILITNKDDKKFPYSIIQGNYTILKGSTQDFVLKLKEPFCKVMGEDTLNLTIVYGGYPEIICHGKRLRMKVKTGLDIKSYPVEDLKVSIGNTTVDIVDIFPENTTLLVYDGALINAVNDYLRKCQTPYCIIPINISVSSDASLFVSDLRVVYTTCLLNEELLAHILSCWEAADYGKEKNDFSCYEITVPAECSGFLISPESIASLLKTNELCDVIQMKDYYSCGNRNDLLIKKSCRVKHINLCNEYLFTYADFFYFLHQFTYNNVFVKCLSAQLCSIKTDRRLLFEFDAVKM